MRAGQMDRTVRIERVTTSQNDSGAVGETWSTFATMRAQLVQVSTTDFQRAFGASTESSILFRTWFVDGITLADRLIYNTVPFRLKEIKEIGRRKGLELRCERIGP